MQTEREESSPVIELISVTAGWIYFAAWSMEFYPQIHHNYVRNSVVGLNFDFVALGLIGFLMYAFYNCGLYFFETVQKEYFERYGKNQDGVRMNDVFYSVHAFFATLFITYQCIVLEKAEQTLSWVTIGFASAIVIFTLVSSLIAALGRMAWLDFLYYCSFIKLFITIVKYVPQVTMNYQRQSTEGESIHHVFLDFTGGAFCITQILLDAYNDDDLKLIEREYPKLAVGLVSILFDITIFLQHFVFFREEDAEAEDEEDNIDET